MKAAADSPISCPSAYLIKSCLFGTLGLLFLMKNFFQSNYITHNITEITYICKEKKWKILLIKKIKLILFYTSNENKKDLYSE